MSSTESGKLQGSRALMLAVGVVALELAAAVSTFVAGTLLPVIERDLSAQRQLPLLLAGGTIGMFTALPLSSRIIARFAPGQVLMVGLLMTGAGSGLAAAAPNAWVFGGGRFVTGFAGALLAVFGFSAATRHLEDSLRLKIVAAMSAMWILPATVGPSATLAVEHLAGWRFALLLPLPLIVLGRLLVVRAVPVEQPEPGPERPLTYTLLVPLGVAAGVVLTQTGVWYLAPLALGVALVGFFALMPSGTARLSPVAPAALAGLTLFGFGYFGANSLVTLLFTQTFGTTLVQAGVALSGAPVAWALASLVATRMGPQGAPPVWGMGLAAASVAVMAVLGLGGGPWIPALVAWTLAGLGIGLSYPGLYVRATTGDVSITASQLATAAITTESFGGLVGSTVGGALGSLSSGMGLDRSAAWCWAFVGFAVFLAFAAVAANRSTVAPPRGPGRLSVARRASTPH